MRAAVTDKAALAAILMLCPRSPAIPVLHCTALQYMERKRKLIKDGRWEKARQHATQYHDVLGFHAGKAIRYISQTIIVLQLIGTGTAQVIACAADWYSVDKTRSKRELQVSMNQPEGERVE